MTSSVGRHADFGTITDDQAETICTAIDILMRVDIGIRNNVVDLISPESVTRSIVSLVDAFYKSNAMVEQAFNETGIYAIVQDRKKLLSEYGDAPREN